MHQVAAIRTVKIDAKCLAFSAQKSAPWTCLPGMTPQGARP